MGIITDIVSGIEGRIAIALPSYSQLAFQVDIETNKFKGNKAGFSVVPDSANEVEGLIGTYTMDHGFIITLVNSYNDGAKSQLGDTLKVERIQELMDDVLLLYKDIVVNKSSLGSNTVLVSNLSIDSPEFIDEENTIKIAFNIDIKYKTALC